MGIVDVRRGGLCLAVLALGLGTGLARAEDDVLVNIRGPLAGTVGDRVAFDVEIVNRSGRNLQQLRVIDYFDAGFRHEASKSPIEQKGTIDLAVGTARRITLEFVLAEPGRQCHRVEILDQAHRFVGGATECVQVASAPAVATAPAPLTPAPPPLVAPVPAPFPAASASTAPPLVPPVTPATPAIALDLVGPAEATSGTVAEYVATVRNTGNAAAAPSTLEFSWDDGFVPLEASDGYSLAASKVSWNLPAIEPGGQLKRQINLRAQAPAGSYRDSPPIRACVRAELAGLAGGGVVGDHECLQIRSTTPRPRIRTAGEAGLRLSLADLDDPVRSGGATTLVCTIANDGDAPLGPLNLVIDLPRGARLVGDARVRVDDGRVMFDAFDLAPGRQQAFEVSYTMPGGGQATALASISGVGLEGRLDRSCQTEFLAP